MIKNPLFLLLYGLLFLLWMKVGQDLSLWVWGELATAQVQLVTQHSGRHTTYTAFYEFTTLDKTLAHGQCPCSKNAEGRSLKIRYLRAFPSINGPANSWVSLFSMLCWGLIAWAIGGFGFSSTASNSSSEDGEADEDGDEQETVQKHAPLPTPTAPALASRPHPWRRSLWIGFFFVLLTVSALSPSATPVWNLFRASDAAEAEQTAASDEGALLRGSSLGNPENGSLFAVLQDQIYFHMWSDYQGENPLPKGIYSCPMQGEPMIPVPVGLSQNTSEIYKGMAAFDGWIYYTKMQGLARIRPDGSHPQTVVKDRITAFCIVNGVLFYQMEYDSRRIYRAKLNGSGKKRLCMEETGVFSVAGDGWIYYTNLTDQGRLYRMREDGSRRQAIHDILPTRILAEPDRCWFIDSADHALKCWRGASDQVEVVYDDHPVQAFSLSQSLLVLLIDDKFYTLDPSTGAYHFVADNLAEYDDFSIFDARIYLRANALGHGPVMSIGLNDTQWTHHTVP